MDPSWLALGLGATSAGLLGTRAVEHVRRQKLSYQALPFGGWPMPKPSEKHPLWRFIDEDGSFHVENPVDISRLYFPLGNEAGMLSSITPDLHGDIKTDQNHFLTLPVSTEDLHNTRSARNFWMYSESMGAWSATGNSSWQQQERSVDVGAEDFLVADELPPA